MKILLEEEEGGSLARAAQFGEFGCCSNKHVCWVAAVCVSEEVRLVRKKRRPGTDGSRVRGLSSRGWDEGTEVKMAAASSRDGRLACNSAGREERTAACGLLLYRGGIEQVVADSGVDSFGHIEGKDTEYRNITQTVVELLDDLCEKMLDHTLEKLDTGEEIWVRVHDWNNLPAGKDKQEAQTYSKYISSFCTRLLEETKDELMELLQGSVLKPGQISKALCQDLSMHCDESDDFDDDYMDDEL